MKDPIKKLISFIYQIIGKNKFLLSALECIKQRDNMLVPIELSCYKGSEYIHSTNTLRLSIKDMIRCLELSKNKRNLNIKIKFNLTFNDCSLFKDRCNEVVIEKPGTEGERQELNKIIEKLDYFKNNYLSIYDSIAFYSLSYSLCHEIGHVLHDKYIHESEPIKREKAADSFAFEAVKSMRVFENNDVLLLGVLIGMINVLGEMTPQKEEDDKEHPHTIERICTLLDFWEIEDESCFWEISYNEIKDWCSIHNQSMKWDKDASFSYKDRVVSASIFFKKD